VKISPLVQRVKGTTQRYSLYEMAKKLQKRQKLTDFMQTNLWNVICSVLGVMGFIHLQHLHDMLCLVSGTWFQILEEKKYINII
jgi:hypothetical protein